MPGTKTPSTVGSCSEREHPRTDALGTMSKKVGNAELTESHVSPMSGMSRRANLPRPFTTYMEIIVRPPFP